MAQLFYPMTPSNYMKVVELALKLDKIQDDQTLAELIKKILNLPHNNSDIQFVLNSQRVHVPDLSSFFAQPFDHHLVIQPSANYCLVCSSKVVKYTTALTTIYTLNGPKMIYRISVQCKQCSTVIDGNIITDNYKRKFIIPNTTTGQKDIFRSSSQTWISSNLLRNFQAHL